ncbi:MAG TPA: glycoside hydrolase family 9 protein, partial [Capsulimonadaceae bacterium]|nr:glycoside hydrolase family 9 protein [Capsulimonadaceae bacterium]
EGGAWTNSVGKTVIDPTPHDVTGGWWDAGDFDKYTANEVPVQDQLLFAVELLGDAGKKAHLNIPPSAGHEYDLLDTIRYCTEFLIKDCDSTGAAFGRVHTNGTSPPEADTQPVQLSTTNSTSTMARAGALALASVIWTDRHQDPAFAKKCYQESLRSWNLLQERPYPWPVDPKDPAKELYSGDIDTPNIHEYRALAAACYFRITGDKKYDQIVHEETADWKTPQPGDDPDRYPIYWVYDHTKGADPALIARFNKLVLDSADQVVLQTGDHRGYAACIRGYWWGCNRLIGSSGVNCLYAAQLTTDPAAKKKYLTAAEEYVHYLFGRNAIGLCFFTNLGSLGAEHSAMVMFHSWVGNFYSKNPDAQKYIGDGPGKIGPFPGMVVGGVQPTMKHYINDLDWHHNPWEWNEPDIGYQAPCATLVAYFALMPPAS